jgi:hypothetical protein
MKSCTLKLVLVIRANIEVDEIVTRSIIRTKKIQRAKALWDTLIESTFNSARAT